MHRHTSKHKRKYIQYIYLYIVLIHTKIHCTTNRYTFNPHRIHTEVYRLQTWTIYDYTYKTDSVNYTLCRAVRSRIVVCLQTYNIVYRKYCYDRPRQTLNFLYPLHITISKSNRVSHSIIVWNSCGKLAHLTAMNETCSLWAHLTPLLMKHKHNIHAIYIQLRPTTGYASQIPTDA